MGDKTGIEWTDATWNPIRGCSRVSEGCRNCYAEKTANRFKGAGQPYDGLVQLANGHPQWTGKIKFVEEHLLDPLKWKPVFLACEVCGVRQYQCACDKFNHRPRRIFINSMSDLFHENVTDEMRDRIFAVMALCPQHTFQVLTKRPERMLAYLTELVGGKRKVAIRCAEITSGLSSESEERAFDEAHSAALAIAERWWPGALKNVWLGVSVENQATADERIPLLLQTPAAVRFISAEPMLGPVDLTVIPREANVFDVSMPGFDRCKGFYLDALSGSNGIYMLDGSSHEEPLGMQPKLDWVICGGESGPGARPMHPDWARGLRDQCVAAGVPFFFKQWGRWMHGSDFRGSARIVLNDGRVVECPVEDLPQSDKNQWCELRAEMMAPVGKKLAGNLLDGVEWHQFPVVAR